MTADNKKMSVYFIIKKCFTYTAQTAGKTLICTFLIGSIYSILWALNTLLMQSFFDTVQISIQNKAMEKLCYLFVLIIVLYFLITQLLHGFYIVLYQKTERVVQGYARYILHSKVLKIDPLEYEKTSFLDFYEKAENGTQNVSSICLLFFTIFAYYGLYFITLGAYFYKLNSMLPILIIIIFIPSLFNLVIRSPIFAKLEDDTVRLRRKLISYEDAMCGEQAYKETRMNGSYSFLLEKYKSTMRLFNSATWQAEKRADKIEMLVSLISVIAHVVVILMLFTMMYRGYISAGAFAAILGSMAVLTEKMNDMVVQSFGGISQKMASVQNFIKFLDYPERGGERRKTADTAGIILDNVSFKYPGSKDYELKNISLEIKEREKIAIVGKNGAGKTTLAKIISGIYIPEKGSVYIAGKQTDAVCMHDLFYGTSAVMQLFQHYKMTLEQNIKISDVDSVMSIDDAVNEADLSIDKKTFPKGIETVLSRDFEGVELSGGQWQRIAIARGLYRSHDLILLDEPTAAIDPIEETMIFKKFSHVSEGKTSIIITHRLGSAMIADRIILLEKGEIAEMGTHEALMRQKGLYYNMYMEQRKWYS